MEFICFTLNNNAIYTEPNNPNCLTSTNQIQQNNNPPNDILSIEFENTEQRELIIFNPISQMVLNETSNQMNVQLSLEQ